VNDAFLYLPDDEKDHTFIVSPLVAIDAISIIYFPFADVVTDKTDEPRVISLTYTLALLTGEPPSVIVPYV
jgi:hypothetical protein